MERLTDQQWGELRAGAQVLAADEHGEKVLLRPDGRIMKLFRRKRLLSSALWRPYASRFAHASECLKKLGFRAVKVERSFRISSIRRDVVVYPMLEGLELRAALAGHPERGAELLERFILLLAELHAAGVYFRAIHFGNVLVWRDGPLGLIDLSEAQFFQGPLGPGRRARNFRPLRKYAEDAAAIDQFGRGRFVERYLHQARLDEWEKRSLLSALQKVDAAWMSAR